MRALQVAVISGALLVLASGAWKLRNPSSTARALAAADLPSAFAAVRVLGVIEIATGAAALVGAPRPWALPLAGLYAGFMLFVLWALARRLPLASCGCFGAADTPPSVAHVVVDSVVASSCVAVAIDDARERGAVVWIASLAVTASVIHAFTRRGRQAGRS